MKTDSYKTKNYLGEYTGQLDRGEIQIVVITNTAKKLNTLMVELRKILVKYENRKT